MAVYVWLAYRLHVLDLQKQLTVDLKTKLRQLEILHGGMTDTEQQDLVERFGRLDDPLRVLLCSDVASEGLNLHYFCHRLVHFDLPWSLMVFQQRNGRVDRYGQKHQPQIVYLFTETTNEPASKAIGAFWKSWSGRTSRLT